jgi:hypothetical protein
MKAGRIIFTCKHSFNRISLDYYTVVKQEYRLPGFALEIKTKKLKK